MANYVRNILYPEGIGISKFFRTVKGNNQAMDFNKIIPMPPSLMIESGSLSSLSLRAEIYARDGIVSDDLQNCFEINRKEGESIPAFLQRMEKEKRIDPSLGKKAYENKKKYGHADWYSWSIDRWGTKWNAMDSKREENRLIFDTAWSAPEPVMIRLAAMFPEIRITHIWADEDAGSNCGKTIYRGGKLDEFLPLYGSEEAYGIYEECWGELPEV